MKKLIVLIFIMITIVFNLASQSILPLQSSEQCPGLNIVFTVTIAANRILSVSPKALTVNPEVIQQPYNIISSGSYITFNFIGRFSDYNNKQTFTVNYVNTSGQIATWDATYIKIKSLFTANYFTQIYPTPVGITVPLCQIQSFNIRFSNVTYGNPWETPPIGYVSITNYQYLLPNGWKLGSTTSNGSTWLNGNNNITVTSDLISGNSTGIRIRPVNTSCGSGLAAGQEAYVSISRPAPIFTISGPNQFCTTGTYTITSLPAGATVQWYITPASYFTYSQSNNVLSVNRVGDGDIHITAKVTVCQTFNAIPKDVRGGGNPITINATQTACDATDFSVEGAASAATYNWSSANGTILYNGTSTNATTSLPYISATTSIGNVDIAVVNTNNSCYQSVFVSKQLQYTFPRQIDGMADTYSNGDQINASVNTTAFDSYYTWYINGVVDYEDTDAYYYSTTYSGVGRNIVCGENTIRAEVTTCGITTSSEEVHFNKMGNCYFRSTAPNVEVYPNPAKDLVTIKLKDFNKHVNDSKNIEVIREIRVLNKFGKTLKIFKLPLNTKLTTININNLPFDIYFIEVSDGKNKAMLQLSIQN